MKRIVFFLFLMCAVVSSQIPEFDVMGKFNIGLDTYEGICFVDWNSDGLVDIISAPEAEKLKFYQNIGTLSSPTYEDRGYLTDAEGNDIYFRHG